MTSIDGFVIIEIIFMRFVAWVGLCASDGIVISNQSTSGDGEGNSIPVRVENWMTR